MGTTVCLITFISFVKANSARGLTHKIVAPLTHPLPVHHPLKCSAKVYPIIIDKILTCRRRSVMAMLRGTPSGQYFASNRKCISAGEPSDKPATKGPKPISSSVWNCTGDQRCRCRDTEEPMRTAIFCRSIYAALINKIVSARVECAPCGCIT